ncbi:MAG: DUF6985 domain-containing protein [Chitinophagales bacterium]
MTLNFEKNKSTIILQELTQSDKKGNEHFSSRGEERRNKGEVELYFFGGEFEFSTEPSKEQINALNFIETNQENLVEAFFKYTKEVLYPTHIEFIGYDDVSFPEIEKIKDLRKSLGLSEIYIWKEHKNEIAYVAFGFDFTGDFEHGVKLIVHKNRILGWEEDLANDKVLVDKE